MSIVQTIKEVSAQAITELYRKETSPDEILINQTKPEFEGDFTVVLFSLIKQLKRSPEELGRELGDRLTGRHPDLFTGYNVIKGFLNLVVVDDYFIRFLSNSFSRQDVVEIPSVAQKVVVEYSSPNTNKPLHLGHLRNNFLGWSIAEILKANGHTVTKT